MEAAPAAASRDHDSPKIRKPRAARACEFCRAKKNKCDELQPCTYCRRRGVDCVYRNADRTRRVVYSSEYVKELERQVRALSTPETTLKTSAPSSARDDTIFQVESPVESTPQSTEGSFPHQSPISNGRPGSSVGVSPGPSHSHHQTSASKEVAGVNRHTKNVEFYGSSSSISLLRRVSMHDRSSPGGDDDEAPLVSHLHNPGFPSSSRSPSRLKIPTTNSLSYYQRCRKFIDHFFGSLHYVHPILDKLSFLERCEELWSGNGDVSQQKRSFMALYYSLLSLGALVGPRDEEVVDGKGNMEWSRKFFEEARALCGELSMTTDLEMVQCFFFMAKICQNELNPHLTYMYTGLAVRTALAMGINREPRPNAKKSLALIKAETRTWWGLYSLETEMSFAMGRPDTLGADAYHNRSLPVIQSLSSPPSDIAEPAVCAIIMFMVGFSRITRTVCLEFYQSYPPDPEAHATRIEYDLGRWWESLPSNIRPSRTLAESEGNLKGVKDPQWVKRQRLVLTMRYHNVRMLLFAPFLTTPSMVNIGKCLDSAKQTIDIIYDTFRHHDFFRTWYYNTTYTLFAVSILLVYIMQGTGSTYESRAPLFPYIVKAIEILEIMDDCIVAKKAAKMIRRALDRAKDAPPPNHTAATETPTKRYTNGDYSRSLNHYWGPLNLMDGEIDVSFPFEMGDLDGFMIDPGMDRDVEMR